MCDLTWMKKIWSYTILTICRRKLATNLSFCYRENLSLIFELSEFNVIANCYWPKPSDVQGGQGGEVVVTPSEVFVFAPDVFSNCSFIPCAHFERSLVMVSYYGYEI